MSVSAPLLRLEIAGETAMACYFLMAHCPNDAPPTLDSESSPLAIVFTLGSPAVLESIRTTLERAQGLDGAIASSARALMKIVEEKTTRTRPPGTGAES